MVLVFFYRTFNCFKTNYWLAVLMGIEVKRTTIQCLY